MSAPTILVIGSGRSAVEAAREVVAQRGHALLIRSSISRVCALRIPTGIEVLDGVKRVELEGSVGRFKARVHTGDEVLDVEAGAVIVTEERQALSCPVGLALNEAVEAPLPDVARVVIVLGPAASRQDHLSSIRLAAALRSRSPPTEVTVFIEEALVRGVEELEYAEAQRSGARFVRVARPPAINTSPKVTVEAEDVPSGIAVVTRPDLLVMAGFGLEPTLLQEGIDISEGRGTVSMGPSASLREGVLLCRPGERELAGDDLLTEARAAATRAITLARNVPQRTAAAARVDRDRCSACLTCVRTCPFHAPRIDQEGIAVVEAELCQACGCCAAACPSQAIGLPSDQGWMDRLPSDQKVKP